MLGQTTRVERSTVEQVRAKIAALREETREAQTAKSFDFDRRLADIKAKEDAIRAGKKAKRKAEKEEQRLEMIKATTGNADDGEPNDMAMMMGFAGFGTTKK